MLEDQWTVLVMRLRRADPVAMETGIESSGTTGTSLGNIGIALVVTTPMSEMTETSVDWTAVGVLISGVWQIQMQTVVLQVGASCHTQRMMTVVVKMAHIQKIPPVVVKMIGAVHIQKIPPVVVKMVGGVHIQKIPPVVAMIA